MSKIKIMSLVPNFFCDNCGHAFNNPETRGRGWLNVSSKDEEDCDDRCPKCGCPDFEPLVLEEVA